MHPWSVDVILRSLLNNSFARIVLDTNLTGDLVQEGYAREVISKLQTMRKDAGFEVTDRIEVCYTANDTLAAALEAWDDMIRKATLTLSLTRGAAPEGFVAKDWDINGQKATLALRKA